VAVARRQLMIREQRLGSSHPEVARSLPDLATFQVEAGVMPYREFIRTFDRWL
jgi:hypothetical protein